MSESVRLRVLVCDDDPMIHEALCELLAEQDDMEVVGVGTNAAEAIDQARRHRPDVIILDLRMPGNGTHAAREIRRLLPEARILAFSAYADRAAIASMRAAGADHHLVKGARNDEILAAVRRLALSGQAGG